MNSTKLTLYPFCETGVLEHPRYFPRQLMTPEDLILEHNYFRNKLRRHNRLLHGWGVVCGAIVCRVPIRKGNGKDSGSTRKQREDPCPEGENCLDPWKVLVTPGYILGPYGDEIVIGCETVVDVRHTCTTGVSGDPCPPPPDPWCSDVIVDPLPGKVFLAVRYKEVMTRPVRAQPVGCGCDETACEYSRIRDCFEICTLHECPESHQDPPEEEFECTLDTCPPCPDEPWVVLARICLGTDGIKDINNYSCRRIVRSFANFWCQAEDPDQAECADAEDENVNEEEARSIIAGLVDVTEEELLEVERLMEVGAYKAIQLRGVTPRSQLGKKLEAEGMTIGDVAGMQRRRFIKFALEGEPASRHRQIENQADEVWKRASQVMEALRGQPTSIFASL